MASRTPNGEARRRPPPRRLWQEGTVNKQLVITLLKYGLGFGLLGWVVWWYWEPTDAGPGLRDALEKPIHFGPFALAFLIYLLSILITFYRWYVLVRAQDLPFTVAGAMRLGMIAFYVSTFLPGSVGGDIIKAAFIVRGQSRRTVAIATIAVDRFMGLCGLFWVVATVGTVAWASGYLHEVVNNDKASVAFLETVVLTAVGAVVGTFVMWMVAGLISDSAVEKFARGLERIWKVGVSLAELWRALHMYRRRGRAVATTLAMSIVGHVGFVMAFYFSALTLSDVDSIPALATHFLIVPVGMTITAGVPTPGGVGGAELAFGMLYKIAGSTSANGVLGSLVQRVVTWSLGLLGYFVSLRTKLGLTPTPAEPRNLAPMA
jgi:uncharacterized membrane protein YbhN (UPF0104 family)